MKQALAIILIFLFPAITSFFLLLFLMPTFQLAGLIENTLFSILFILLSILITNKKYRSRFLCFGAILNTLIIFCETAYYYLYGYNISESTIYILMETHRAEAYEFLSMFVDKDILFFFIIFFIPLFFICRLINKRIHALEFCNLDIFVFKRFLVPVIMLVIISIIVFTSLKTHSLPFTTFKSLYTYKNTVVKLNRLIKDKEGGKFTNVHLKNLNEKSIYVIIIGESATRNHLGLYGYNRQTTPLLNEIKDELYIYTNVIAPHTTTIQVLIKALTPGDYENSEKTTDGTLMQLMNRAGFKTYWISNQKPFGTYESITSKLSKTACERVFLNSSSSKSTLAFDEDLFEPFKHALKDTVFKKLIIVHLLGVHAEYEKRYPSEFDVFTDKPQTKFRNENAFKIINEYDNAIVYNDFIIRNLIEEVRQTAVNAYVLYFSDHGEDVFETKDMAFHSESEGTKPMYDIPFFVWLSDDFKKNLPANLVFDVNRKYMTDDLIYSIASLSDVGFDEYESGRSIFDEKFKSRERRIYNNFDYDVLFSE
jgi:heptose-I-phosphate ethanolaminephosphotransferase